MNEPAHRKRNRRLGIILSLLFVGLFIIATRVMITGSKVPPTVEVTMESIKNAGSGNHRVFPCSHRGH